MPDRPFNVLFLCTGNTARSILAESILRKVGAGKFQAFSAGSHPKGVVNPFALKILAAHNFPTDDLRSKSWEEYGGPGAPHMDLIVTVCDSAAGEACPLWPGQPITAHWGIEDPASVVDSDLHKERAFEQAFRLLSHHIEALVALPIANLDNVRIQDELRKLGGVAGASNAAVKE